MSEAVQQTIYLTKDEFAYFQKKIFILAGISLSPAKMDLVQARLRSRVLDMGFSSYNDYAEFLESRKENDPEWEIFINSLTTNKTDWFREPDHFEYLVKEFLPAWLKLGKKHLNVWCAASSTGEEPYTLSLVLHEALKNSGVSFDILASDIDTKVLKFAKNGVYRKEHLHQIPTQYHKEAFALGTQEISDWFKVKPFLKEKVKFKQINLMSPGFDSDTKFDIIFCRNVLIYFNQETIFKVAQTMHGLTHKDGCLIIAHSESLQNIKTNWKYIKPSIYGKGRIS